MSINRSFCRWQYPHTELLDKREQWNLLARSLFRAGAVASFPSGFIYFRIALRELLGV